MGLVLSRTKQPTGVQPWPADIVTEFHPSKAQQIVRMQYDNTSTLDDIIKMERKFKEEEEEVTRRVNPCMYCFIYFLLCCQPLSVLWYELPPEWQRHGVKETIVVDLGSRQFSKRRNGLLLRTALYVKHVLETHCLNFGFRNVGRGAEEFQV